MDGLTELQDFDSVSGRSGRPGAEEPAETAHGSPLIAAPPGATRSTSAQIFDEVLEARDDERRRIGQELHDSAGQLVVSLQLSIAHLKQVHETSEIDLMIEEIRDTVRQIDSEIRSLSFLNCPAELGTHGLAGALRMLAIGFSRRTGIEISFDSQGDVPASKGPASVALLRVAQEALVNIHRHSQATAARVSLRRGEGFLKLLISDNGIGMPTIADFQETIGVGLRGMRYRIEQVGGRFEIRRVKRGSRIAAWVPLKA